MISRYFPTVAPEKGAEASVRGGDYGGPNNNQLQLTKCGNFTGQLWRLVPDGNWFRLTTKFRGDNMCADVFNGGANDNQPYLKPCANFTGQHWLLSSTGKRA